MKNLLRLLPLLLLALLATGCEEGEPDCESDVFCDGQCTDIGVDKQNCGGCGNVCAAGFECVEGACECAPGETACGDRCVVVESDAANCGACGNACGEGEICEEGACVGGTCEGLECEIDGATACIDPTTDEQNCGACGNVCADGTTCLGGSCTVGNLYGACFSDGSVVPLLKSSHTVTNPKATGIDGPQALALLGDDHLVAVGSLDQTLYVIDRATMQTVGSLVVGSTPNQVIVREERAYVIASGQNTVHVVDLSDPTKPTTADEVALGDGVNPMAGAFDDRGFLWVSSWLQPVVIPVDFSGENGVKEEAVTLETEGVEGTPYPSGVAVVGEMVYVTFNNLGEDFSPAGNGRLATLNRTSGETGLVDLGETCTNPGFTAVSGTDIVIACTDSYWQGEVAIFDTTSGTVTRRISTGGGPARISLDPTTEGRFYVADAAGLGIFAVETDGSFTPVDVCPAPGEGGFEFLADVLAAP